MSAWNTAVRSRSWKSKEQDDDEQLGRRSTRARSPHLPPPAAVRCRCRRRRRQPLRSRPPKSPGLARSCRSSPAWGRSTTASIAQGARVLHRRSSARSTVTARSTTRSRSRSSSRSSSSTTSSTPGRAPALSNSRAGRGAAIRGQQHDRVAGLGRLARAVRACCCCSTTSAGSTSPPGALLAAAADRGRRLTSLRARSQAPQGREGSGDDAPVFKPEGVALGAEPRGARRALDACQPRHARPAAGAAHLVAARRS